MKLFFFGRARPRPTAVFVRRVRPAVVLRRLALGITALAVIAVAAAVTLGEHPLPSLSEDASIVGSIGAPGEEDGSIYERRTIYQPPATPEPLHLAAPAEPVAAAPAPPAREVPYRLVIDKIGVNAPVATYGVDRNAVPEVPTGAGANRTVAWYNFSSRPGTKGNAVLAGHVTWSGRAVFYSLDKLTGGDKIVITDQQGGRFTYTVSEVFLVKANDPNGVSVMYPTDSDMVTLITCGGSPFYVGGTAGYDYTHRLVVRGTLTEALTAEPAQTGG